MLPVPVNDVKNRSHDAKIGREAAGAKSPGRSRAAPLSSQLSLFGSRCKLGPQQACRMCCVVLNTNPHFLQVSSWYVVLLVIASQIEQVLDLPITFLGHVVPGISGVGSVGGSFGSVGSRVNSMPSNVGSCCSVTSGTGGGASCSLIGIASSGVGGECGTARFAHRYFITRPGTPCFNSFSRSVVSRVLLLEICWTGYT